MKSELIEVGQIWEVTTDCFLTSGRNNTYKRPIQLIVGEKIEIRYPYAWHFRTDDDHYFHAEPDMIIQNCRLYGVIWDKVRFANKCKLEDILRLKLLDRNL